MVSLALALGARAEEPPIIALVGRGDARIVRRIRAELSAFGFRVVAAAEDAGQPSREQLEEVAGSSGAIAAVRLAPSSKGIEVWLVDRVTGKTVLREVLDRDAAGADADAVVAVRTVELLRASLLEVDLPHPSRGEIAPTPYLRKAARLPAPVPAEALGRSSPRGGSIVLAGAAAGACVSPGGLGISPSVFLGVHWQPVGRLAVGVTALAPTVPAELSSHEGTADIFTTFIGTGLRLDLRDRESTWVPSLGAGISMLWFHMEGVGRAPAYEGRNDDIVAAGPYAELGLSWRLLRMFALRSELRAAVALPEPVVEFAGREVAGMGRPFLSLTLGFEYRWRR